MPWLLPTIMPNQGKKVKIAILSSFTFDRMKDNLVRCLSEDQDFKKLNVLADFYVPAFNQYEQEIRDGGSPLYAFDPDFTVLFVEVENMLGDGLTLFQNPDINIEEQVKAEKLADEFKNLLSTFTHRNKGRLVVHSLSVPMQSPKGVLYRKELLGLRRVINKFNQAIENYAEVNPQVFVFDYDSWLRDVGKNNAYDPKFDFIASMKIKERYLPDLAREYLRYLKPSLGLIKKVLVLDLDNTLWGGILGEDGFDGIALGPHPPGNAFLHFQKKILALFNRGVILAVNSSNNREEVLHVLDNHPHMVLRRSHFSALKINWQDKVENMREMARELNLGLDSFVFLDDDAANRAKMREMLGEVFTPDLPQDSAYYGKFLDELDVFENLYLTDEDKRRGQLYAEEEQRRTFETAASSLEEFLRRLDLEVKISKDDDRFIPRLAQLTEKTNQFNLRTVRYTQEQVARFVSSPNHIVLSLEAKDRFGEYGLVGLAIVGKESPRWFIDTLLLSCRVIGKGVEKCLLSKIIEEARKSNAGSILGEYIPTGKNTPAASFYGENGFELLERRDAGQEKWIFDINKTYAPPEWIRLV